jgi:hypothetical protein
MNMHPLHDRVLVIIDFCDHHLVHELAPDRTAWLRVVSDEVNLNDIVWRQGDSVGVENERSVSFTVQENTEILLTDLGPAYLLIEPSLLSPLYKRRSEAEGYGYAAGEAPPPQLSFQAFIFKTGVSRIERIYTNFHYIHHLEADAQQCLEINLGVTDADIQSDGQ